MAYVEVRVAAIKTWLKCIKVAARRTAQEPTKSTDADIVDRMAPGVVGTELHSPARQMPTVQFELKSFETRMTAILTNIDSRDIGVQPLAIRVVRAERSDAVGGKPSSNAGRVEQPATATAAEIIRGIELVATGP